VEGGNVHSDWWAAEAAGLFPEKSGKACDFWNRWKEDFDLIEQWGHNCLRFGIEWARTEPLGDHEAGQGNGCDTESVRESAGSSEHAAPDLKWGAGEEGGVEENSPGPARQAGKAALARQ